MPGPPRFGADRHRVLSRGFSGNRHALSIDDPVATGYTDSGNRVRSVDTIARADTAEYYRLIDLTAFGQPCIANPDLAERMRNWWPLTTPDPNSYYGGGTEGYLDYPRFDPATV